MSRVRYERAVLALLSTLCVWALVPEGPARGATLVRPHDIGRSAKAPFKPPPRLQLVLPGEFRHDGFYFRFSTGIGGYVETLNPSGQPIAARTSGIGGTIELGAGGTVAPGWVLGVAAYFDRPLASDLELSDSRREPIPEPLAPSYRDGMLLGPLVDWYPDDSKGLHFQAAVGFVHLSRALYTPGNFDSRSYAANGVGGMIGLGQEWWTSEQDSIGVTTQFFLSTSWGEVQNEGTWQHWRLGTPTFVFTWTHQ